MSFEKDNHDCYEGTGRRQSEHEDGPLFEVAKVVLRNDLTGVVVFGHMILVSVSIAATLCQTGVTLIYR